MATKTNAYAAKWDGGRYIVWAGCELWVSRDGDSWTTDGDGVPATGPRFDAASITLKGGPRDGQTVG